MGWKSRAARAVALGSASIIALAACSGATTRSASGTAPAGGSASGWQSVTGLPASLSGSLQSIAVQGSTFVAVGDRGVRGPGIAWSSPDGQAWTAAPTSPALASFPLRVVTTGPKGLLAIGNDCSGSGECGLDKSVSFLSPDGSTWTAGGLIGGDLVGMWDAVWTGSMYVAVGRDGNSEPDSGRILTSPDGLKWTDASLVPSSQIQSVAADKAAVVAVGHTQLADGNWRVASWTSSDGQTWKPAADQPSLAGGDMLGVVAGSSGFVAVGSGANGAAVWTSPDGLTWSQVADGPDLQGAVMDAVATTATGLVAVGYTSDAAAIWSSTDGTPWSRVADLPNASNAQAVAVASLGKTVVVVGGASPAGIDQAYVWVSR